MAYKIQYMVCNGCHIPCEFYYKSNGLMNEPVEKFGCIVKSNDLDKAEWEIKEIFEEVKED